MKPKPPKTTPSKPRPTVAELHAQADALASAAVRLKIKGELLRERAHREQLVAVIDAGWRRALSGPLVMPPFDPDALARHLAQRAGVPAVKPEAGE